MNKRTHEQTNRVILVLVHFLIAELVVRGVVVVVGGG
jgi:hypothetical protein